MDTIIKVCDVEKFYGNKDTITKAVNRISFEVEKESLPLLWSQRKRKDHSFESSCYGGSGDVRSYFL